MYTSSSRQLEGVHTTAAAAAAAGTAAIAAFIVYVLCPELMHCGISSSTQRPKVHSVGSIAAAIAATGAGTNTPTAATTAAAANVAAQGGGWQQWLLQQRCGSSGEAESPVVGCC